MTKITITPRDDGKVDLELRQVSLEKFCDEKEEELRIKYHTKPTGLRHLPSDNAQSAYDAQGRHEAARWDGWMGREAHGRGKR